MSAPTRRALLASPAAAGTAATLAAGPAAAPPPHPDLVCIDLGRYATGLVREYQRADRLQSEAWSRGEDGEGHRERMVDLLHALDAAQRLILVTRPVTVADVLPELVCIMERVNAARENLNGRKASIEAVDAIRQCLVALAEITGLRLSDLAADFIDHRLSVQLQPEIDAA